MKTEKLFKLVLMELTSDSIKLELELEKMINSDDDVSLKIIKIKQILKQMNDNESSVIRFTNMITPKIETDGTN